MNAHADRLGKRLSRLLSECRRRRPPMCIPRSASACVTRVRPSRRDFAKH